ncbi:hypothetical protein RUND412_001064 [Rhizina undulata]
MDAHQPLDPAPLWYIGHHLPVGNKPINGDTVQDEAIKGYDMITAYITNDDFRTRVDQLMAEAVANGISHSFVDSLVATEVNIHPGDHMSQVICSTSSCIELDSNDPLVAHVSKQVLNHELAYAAFCGANNVLIGGPKSSRDISQYAQAINTALLNTSYMQLLIELPMFEEERSEKDDGAPDLFSTWDIWNTIRTTCKYNSRLGIALRLPAKYPNNHVVNRWFAEPLRVILISSSIFCSNAKGYPVLSKFHQNVLSRYMRLRPTAYLLLSDTHAAPPTSGPASAQKLHYELHNFLVYIRHLQKTQPAATVAERFGSGYQDYLQAPLQPLSDNLESITYEVFEKDPVKYNQYEKAIELALRERNAEENTVVAVVGAGRGPLVSRALRAAQSSGRKITLYAVEKNPNAYVHLLRHNEDTWGRQVTVVKSDMRSWKPPVLVDILISELLGSFGDNELSPECLDGVQRVLNPSGGISIPASYTAHFTPIMAPKIYADISSRKGEPDAPETPYVVMLQAIEILAQDEYIHNAWEFSHPAPQKVLSDAAALGGGLVGLGDGGNDHNLRRCKTTFKVPRRGVVHGLAGYFESVLFGDVELSTRPDAIDLKSKDMTSWFPIFFPLKAPIYVPDNSELDISISRETSERKVWYEWMVEAFISGPASGKRQRIGVSDLHSSKKNGCMM